MLETSGMVDYPHTAFVMINCEAGQEGSVIEQIRSIRGVKEVLHTRGPHDILSCIEAPTVDSLRDIIENKIRRTSYVKTTTTLIKSF